MDTLGNPQDLDPEAPNNIEKRCPRPCHISLCHSHTPNTNAMIQLAVAETASYCSP